MGESSRDFYLFKRKGSSIYQCQLVSPVTGKRLGARSTGESVYERAIVKASVWARDGVVPSKKPNSSTTLEAMVSAEGLLRASRSATLTREQAAKIVRTLSERGLLPTGKKSEDPEFVTWLRTCWTFETSPYIQEKLTMGHRFGKNHAKQKLYMIKTHYVGSNLQGKRLSEITRQDLKSFGLSLASKPSRVSEFGEALSNSTINKILSVALVPLKWAARNDLILTDPTLGVRKFAEQPKKRGILTAAEVESLFEARWCDERQKVAALVAFYCGLRVGEIQALKLEDIEEDAIAVRHSWSVVDGLKGTKTGDERRAVLIPKVRSAILALAKTNPWGNAGFIFYSEKADEPVTQRNLVRGLYFAMRQTGITDEQRKSRNICFHSARHWFLTLTAKTVALRDIGLVSGHSPEMAAHYANHQTTETWKTVRSAVFATFGAEEAGQPKPQSNLLDPVVKLAASQESQKKESNKTILDITIDKDAEQIYFGAKEAQ